LKNLERNVVGGRVHLWQSRETRTLPIEICSIGVKMPSLAGKSMSDQSIRTRASLLERLKDLGDQTSWQEFYQTYHELIYSVARRAGLNENEADDVVQETLIAVVRKMPGFTYDPTKDSFKGWLLTVTRWEIGDQLQRRARDQERRASPGRHEDQSTRTATIERVPDPGGSELLSIWDEEWGKHVLQKALARVKRQVNPQHYEIYHLHVILGQPVSEVIRALRVNRGQIYLAKHRVGNFLEKEVRILSKAEV
jgi:RNA polymerase sigma-70 factor (ECF subfamily)